MTEYSRTSGQWLALSHGQLTERVRSTVRNTGPQAVEVWAAVASHPVLVARVRGILSALQAQMAGRRDEAMWTAWIAQARSHLNRPVVEAKEQPERLDDDSSPAEEQVDELRKIVLVEPPAHSVLERSSVAPLVFRAPGQ